VQEILARHGRTGDYVEISLESKYRYNPLHKPHYNDVNKSYFRQLADGELL